MSTRGVISIRKPTRFFVLRLLCFPRFGLPPPPSSPPEIIVTGTLAQAGNPVPVPDAMVAPDQIFASVGKSSIFICC